MAQSRSRVARVGAVVAVVCSALLAGVSVNQAAADVTAVKGSAFGVFADNIALFGGAQPDTGPVPVVALPSGGSSSPVTESVPTTLVQYGPATIFSSNTVSVSTQGTTGPDGSVTTSATIADVNTSGAEIFTATQLSSTCSASEAGVTGSTTVTGGTVRTHAQAEDHDEGVVTIPTDPPVDYKVEGHVHLGTSTDFFVIVFNEQVVNADGTITVNAAHEYFGATLDAQGNIVDHPDSILQGDLIVGQVVCGVTATPTTTTTTAPGATTTTAQPTTTTAQATTTTAQATTTTAAGQPTTTTTAAPATTGVGGSAYGYYVRVSLFGGPAGERGPAPIVTLPEGGSAAPITDTLASATAQFGPAIIFSSDQLEVSTEGTPGGTVTSSATITNVNRSEQEMLTLARVNSTCTASASGQTGSVTLTGGELTTSLGSDFDSEADDTVVVLPESPAPNTSYQGAIENVGDRFEIVFNEQIRSPGQITVNAVHMRLLGPIAVGELIIGQVVCSTTGGAGGGASAAGTGTVAGGGGGGGLASTGAGIAVFVAFAMMLLVGGSTTTYWLQGVRLPEPPPRRMPWTARRLLR